ASVGTEDAFLAKFDSSGTHLFSKRFGASVSQTAYSWLNAVARDAAGNVVVVATVYGTSVKFGGAPLSVDGDGSTVIAKFNGSGAHLWSKVVGNAGLSGDAVTMDSDGNVIVAATSVLDPGVFLVKLDSAGDNVWFESFGGSSNRTASAVGTDP